MRRFPPLPAVLLAGWLAACGAQPSRDAGFSAALECVPFARALSGIELNGDAPDWWSQAPGRYTRGQVPQVGAVMVFEPWDRLPHGHLSVVSQVRSAREVLLTQANWVHHRVTTDQLAVDVSPDGDWSEVRVWWPPTAALGSTTYPVYGFIYSGLQTSHARLISAVPEAVSDALDE